MSEITYLDKFLHLVAYALMGILFYRAFQTLRIRHKKTLLIILGILSASLYGLSDEIHQHFVPYRDADPLDVIADIAGSVCGVYLYHLWKIQKEIVRKI